MITLYFPGNSPYNSGELESFSKMLNDNSVEHHAQKWLHWDDETLEFDEDAELDRLKEILDEHKNEVHGMMGKSIGTYFTVKAIKELELNPKYVILMGIPTGIEEERLRVYREALKGLTSDIYLIQNKKDPYGPIDEVKRLLDEVEFEEYLMEDDTHKYDYADDVSEIISEYLDEEKE